MVAIEVEVSTSITARQFRGLEFLRDKVGERFVAEVVLHTGTRAVRFGDRLWELPIATIWRGGPAR